MSGPASLKRSWWRALAGGALFALGYALANRFQLTHSVLYRWAANDFYHAELNFALLCGQALALLGALWLLPRGWAVAALVLATASVTVNLGFGQTLGDPLNAARLAWIWEELRQAGNAMGQFAAALAFAAVQVALVLALWIGARIMLRRGLGEPHGRGALLAGLMLLIGPNLLAAAGQPTAIGAERNLYALGLDLFRADPVPPRGPVDWVPQVTGTPSHVLWLVDESIAYGRFAELILPEATQLGAVDFGMAVSLGNCSAPANMALRSGVDVRHAGPGMDLRTTPSIWGYARKAGYRTMLIEGQTKGAPQNIMLAPELALIDEVVNMAGGIDSDREIAARLNAQLKAPGRSFTYAVLRGVHFQYRDHFPPGTVPAGAPVAEQYGAALRYSKDRFFDVLLAGVDRNQVAVVYMSDHGQNFAANVTPHCSSERAAAEYQVPLLAFLPPALARRYAAAPPARRSLSQVFPSTLAWMGYDAATVEARYDNDLARPPLGYVRFGRGVVPLRKGDDIEVEVSARFPPQ